MRKISEVALIDKGIAGYEAGRVGDGKTAFIPVDGKTAFISPWRIHNREGDEMISRNLKNQTIVFR